MNRLSEILSKLRRDKKLLLIVALGITGMVMLCFIDFSSGGNTTKQDNSGDETWLSVEKSVEGRIEELLETIEGVGKVKVYVSIESLGEYVYACDNEKRDSGNNTEKYVLIEDGGDEKGLLLKMYMPKISGAAVSCEGGNSDIVRQKVMSAVTAALDISPNRVYVTEMKKD